MTCFGWFVCDRYSDFIVNEVSLSGEIIHLTSTDLPVIIEVRLRPSCSVLVNQSAKQSVAQSAGHSVCPSNQSLGLVNVLLIVEQ